MWLVQEMQPQDAFDVFICHSGVQKTGFVDFLRKALEEQHDLKVFVDEHVLERTEDAQLNIFLALKQARVGRDMPLMHAPSPGGPRG